MRPMVRMMVRVVPVVRPMMRRVRQADIRKHKYGGRNP